MKKSILRSPKHIANQALVNIGDHIPLIEKAEYEETARNRGVAFAAATLAVSALVAPYTMNRLHDTQNSDVPSSVSDSYDHQKFHYEQIATDSTPWEFANHVDPNHDTRNTLAHLTEQLGHAPQPGDTALVPGPDPAQHVSK